MDRFTCQTLFTAALFCYSFVCGPANASDEIAVARPDGTKSNHFYTNNRAPLLGMSFVKLPIGAIVPKGWLRKQLELEADGMAGHLPEVSPYVKYEGNGWVNPKAKGGWEELPYWIKGYGDLGYVLDDKRIIAESKRWIDGIIATQQADGYFGPEGLRTSLEGGPDVWPHMPVLNALQSYYEYSGDKRVLTLMERYFRWQTTISPKCFGLSWAATRCGDNIESIYWLYNRTGEKWLLDLAQRIHENSADWSSHVCNWHNVNISQGFREPTEYWLQAHDDKFLHGAERNYQEVMGKYGQFPGGGFAGDENCRPKYHDPRQGFETCGMVELMHSFEMLTRITGEPVWADRCEEVAFNSLPAAMTPDLKALHYLTGANMVQLDSKNKSPGIQNRGTMLSYSPTDYRCCQHNHTMGWPYMAEELWLATSDDGLCASLYSASEVTAQVGDGTKVKIVETTDYPFGESIELKLSLPKDVEFPLYLRVPRWSTEAVVEIDKKNNGGPIIAKEYAIGPSYFRLNRRWSDGDVVFFYVPMKLATRTWKENHNAVSIDYGPLTFSLKIGERWSPYGQAGKWPESEVYPSTPFNYGLELDAKEPTSSLKVVRKTSVEPQPFTQESTPIEIIAKARKIPGWTQDSNGLLNVLRQSPVASDEPLESITLIPMGAARLRISAFPMIGTGPQAQPWPKPAEQHASASHRHESDTLVALDSGETPASSGDESIPRFTWWNHKGTKEWVQYDFNKPTNLRGVEVYWFDDTGHGQCRVPKSCKILLRKNGQWVAASESTSLGVDRDRFNIATFAATETDAVRLEVQLRDGFSGGVLQWRLLKP